MDRRQAETTEELIASILRFRRARAEFFDAALFANPAWDMLLQLFAAKLAKRKMTLADFDVGTPASTVARWASALEERGLIFLEGLGAGERRVELSEAAAAKMANLFRSVRVPAPID